MPQTIYSSQVGSETLRAGKALTISVEAGSGGTLEQWRDGRVIASSAITATITVGPFIDDMVLRISAGQGSTLRTSEPVSQNAQRFTDAEQAVADSAVSGGGISGNSQASFAILGDSLSGYCFGAVTITSATASGGVVTVAATGHGMVNGCTYAHYGANEDAFNVSGVTITRIDANSYSYPAPGATGTATGSQFGANLQNLSQHGYMGWARMLSANRPQIVYAGVQGGATAATIGTKYVAAALASGAKNAVVLAGVNNAASAQTAAQIAAEIIASLVEPLVTQGVRVFLMAVWPFSSSHASFATAAPKIPAINGLCGITC